MKPDDLQRTTKGRYFLNTNLLPRLAKSLPDGSRVLFVGTDSSWEYKSLFWNPSKLCLFETMDIKEHLKPDIVGDISNCPQIQNDTYDLLILIGVYEFVEDRPGMFNEINRILKPTGKALLALPGIKVYADEKHGVTPSQIHEKVLPLKIEELYVIEDQVDRPPSSVIAIAVRKDALAGQTLWQR